MALRYAGLVRTEAGYVLPGQRTTDPVSWSFSINLRSGWMMPSAPLRAVGQTWAACVVASPVTDQYLGRVATAYGGGRLPDEFGTCWNSRDVSAGVTPVDCGSPHLSELIAVGTVRDRATATTASVISSCRNLAASVIGRSDPTASGNLAVHISPRSIESSQPAANPLTTVCYVVPTGHSLTGTLVGLGGPTDSVREIADSVREITGAKHSTNRTRSVTDTAHPSPVGRATVTCGRRESAESGASPSGPESASDC